MLAASPLGYPPVEILALLQRLGLDYPGRRPDAA
jgi:hypothetical protein